ncbi:hypothetical protein C900_01270 [Fulvivirga imtechensis AK7]|uniref:VOC domain-containing protein n=1 Tax=Fulvivirga imtechensis AK7 TaxID=1237149 RepID=L8JKP9_9BACT|nr:VOC family protein [Fulvivirga imtechensis]ELR68007.1 hypothetical protein C900_01270 [Fulvivirga imtechensis AK7]
MKTIEMISIPVKDQEQAKEFYTEKAGFDLIYEGCTPDNRKWIQVGLPGNSVSFTLVSGEEHAAPGTLKGTIILTDDIARETEILQSNGIDTERILELPFGKISSFQDPDGNQWVLKEAPQN